MQTRYRIVGADGAPMFEGPRSKVRERLATRKLRDKWETLQIEWCKYEPQHENCPMWKLWGDVVTFMTEQ